LGKPARATPSYFYFSNVTVPRLKEEEKISHKEAVAKTGKIWNELPQEEK
jgi:hypothetical protein